MYLVLCTDPKREKDYIVDWHRDCFVALKISERRYIQQYHGWILRNGHCPLLCFPLDRQYQQINRHPLQFHHQIRTSMSLCNFKCIQKRSLGQKKLFDGVADSFVDFSLCLLLVWVEESLCVGPLPFHGCQSLSGEGSVCVQRFYSSLRICCSRICCSRCCASFLLHSYVLIV